MEEARIILPEDIDDPELERLFRELLFGKEEKK